jgi:hypothetical protein
MDCVTNEDDGDIRAATAQGDRRDINSHRLSEQIAGDGKLVPKSAAQIEKSAAALGGDLAGKPINHGEPSGLMASSKGVETRR